MIRSFLAIELPRTILNRVEEVQGDLKSAHADVRWVNPQQIHLTLKFFGYVEEARIDPIVKSIEEPIRDTSPFFLKARGIGAFPNLRNPRVIWLGLVEAKEVLTRLQKRIEIQLEKLGFQPEDRAFHPHLTLGRMKSSRGKEDLARTMEKHKEEEFGDFQVERMVLFKSDLRSTGPIYTLLRELRLGSE